MFLCSPRFFSRSAQFFLVSFDFFTMKNRRGTKKRRIVYAKFVMANKIFEIIILSHSLREISEHMNGREFTLRPSIVHGETLFYPRLWIWNPFVLFCPHKCMFSEHSCKFFFRFFFISYFYRPLFPRSSYICLTYCHSARVHAHVW